ncbi:MAG: hypothetical protein AAB319_11500, partial [Pseudomonadota bacterium]
LEDRTCVGDDRTTQAKAPGIDFIWEGSAHCCAQMLDLTGSQWLVNNSRLSDGKDSSQLLAHAVRGCFLFGVEVSTDLLRGGTRNA